MYLTRCMHGACNKFNFTEYVVLAGHHSMTSAKLADVHANKIIMVSGINALGIRD